MAELPVPDLLVLGSGVAGLSAAVRARHEGMSVTVLTKGELGWSATRYAQGGVAAALDPTDDSPELHGSDTLAAGEGPARVRELVALGARFDQAAGRDDFARTREGGHSVARVVHAGGDATGAEVERALVAAVQGAGAEIRERWLASDLVLEQGRVVGVVALGPDGPVTVRARHVLVATGGAGQCFAVTTNPSLSTGDGIAMAMRAGAAVADLEFMQFHPTALHHPSMPRPLLSEALRGEGAILRDDHGVAFMGAEHPLADLAPRDVVARAIVEEMTTNKEDFVYLDLANFYKGHQPIADRFPNIRKACADIGVDIERDPIPVVPAAHYFCGGVLVDTSGRSTLSRLYAIGETSCTGVHGGNRLASTSLLEGLTWGFSAATSIQAKLRTPSDTRESGVGAINKVLLQTIPDWQPPGHENLEDPALLLQDWTTIQSTMWNYVGIVRTYERLKRAVADMRELGNRLTKYYHEATVSKNIVELFHGNHMAGIVASAALRNPQSRGAHFRKD
jgi:L-aspartate oxidase